jgi:poly(3-hydroxybutyrate) depolymerase
MTGLSGSDIMITSQRAARSARLAAARAPLAGTRAGSASTASSSNPAPTIRRVIRPPMLPAPTMPARASDTAIAMLLPGEQTVRSG